MAKQVKGLKTLKTKSSQREEFVKTFSKFYEQFFSGFSTSIYTLAELQEKFPEAYEGIRQFGKDPSAIDNMLHNLDFEKRGILLNVLFKAGDFSRRTATLFDSSVNEKRKLAKDLVDFTEFLKKTLK